jgi:hypothetical protein
MSFKEEKAKQETKDIHIKKQNYELRFRLLQDFKAVHSVCHFFKKKKKKNLAFRSIALF